MTHFSTAPGSEILKGISKVIVDNKAYLSEIDGKIGDGDHGVNMAKGFDVASSRLQGDESLDAAMQVLSDVLLQEIGGSMGPLYGTLFMDMAVTIEGQHTIDAALFGQMLRAGLEGVMDIGEAKLGDKTLLDTLIPAVDAFQASINEGKHFDESLDVLVAAAVKGRDSTVDLVSKVGRSARLGERSRGVVDAGATSCCLILASLVDQVKPHLKS